MDRRDFIRVTGGVACLSAKASPLEAARDLLRNENSTCPTRVISTRPPFRWEDAMLSGNGSAGIMVMGLPLEDCVVVNHEKFWTVGNDFRPQTPDLRASWKVARKMAQQGRYLDADKYNAAESDRQFRALHPDKPNGGRPHYDRTHPGFHFHISTKSSGAILNYRRETNLETGEVSVFWTDDAGDWVRRVFVSRTDNLIVMKLEAPAGASLNASLRFSEAPGKLKGDVQNVNIQHSNEELYFHSTYARNMGREKLEGYHGLARVIVQDGRAGSVENERLEIVNSRKALILLRVEYLDDAAGADRTALRRELSELPVEYEKLLGPHAAAHGEMFNRVTLDLGGQRESPASTEQLIADAAQGKSLPAFFELLHAVGRYALICGATGELAPSLMGIWGNEWNPSWNGRYTFDANLNFAISAVSQGNLPEAMQTYTGFLERNLDDWRRNAQRMYGCRGALTDLCQGWRHGAVLMPDFPWTGGVGWLASYLYDHFLFTQDTEFLSGHVVPMLKDAADFYEDFLRQYPEKDGRYVFYPSISPENSPVMTPEDQSTNVVPNATCEIAICRQVLTNLLAACALLGIERERRADWEKLLARLPEYTINKEGALAEWSYPGLGDNYNHRHSSHLYGIYPGLEISTARTPKLFEAARVAMEKRLAAGMGNQSAFGLMHVSLVAARLKNAGLMGRMLSTFAQLPFMNTGFISCHNAGPRIYNLDATFSMPGVLTEMLVFSEPGSLELLPALPAERFARGTLRGLLARGGVVIEELHWNNLLGYVHVSLFSRTTQSLQLRFGIAKHNVDAAVFIDNEQIPVENTDHWTVRLSAGKSLRLRCSY